MLSNRLNSITKFIEPKDRIIDVGCDHAYLPIHLYKNKICEFVIASDKNQNALDYAIKNIKNANLEGKIPTIISDGIENIGVERYEINTLVLSGMGTTTILKILENEQVKYINKLIIQSNNDHYLLRKTLNKKGLYIKEEIISKDNDKYYITICFVRGNKKHTENEYYWGILNKENLDYYIHVKNNYDRIYNMIPSNKWHLRYKTRKLIKQLNNIIKMLS